MSRNARSQKYKTLDKLINAGFTEDKQIAELKFKDIAKIKGLTKQDMDMIAALQDAIGECKNINPFLKFLVDDEMKI